MALALPDNLAVEQGGGFGGAEVVVEVEVFGVGGLVALAQVEEGWGRLPLGGEDEGGVVVAGIGGGLLHLVDGEVFDLADAERVTGVAELGAGELGGGGPGGEDGGLGELAGEDADGLLVEDDHVAIGEVVLGGEGVGRVDPDAGEEGCGGEGGEPEPFRYVALPDGYVDEEDEWVKGQEVAGEESAAEDGVGDPVGEDDYGDCVEGWTGDLVGAAGVRGTRMAARVQRVATNMFMCVVRWRRRCQRARRTR